MKPAVWILLLGTCLSIGCADKNGPEAPSEYLKPAGWLEPGETLKGDSFADYEAATRQLVAEHRLYFDSAKAADPATELQAITPKEYAPAEQCKGGAPVGIAILVHGLSDTAFALHDLAEHLASRCYIARTALLPGHGTRAGDLMVVDHHDWLDTIRYLTKQAAAEHDNVILGGFSLGAALTLTIAIEKGSPVRRVIGISPAYSISASRLARAAPILDRIIPWVKKSPPDDYARYGTSPSRSVSETVSAIRHLKSVVASVGDVKLPWLLIQSVDDRVIHPDANMAFHEESAKHPDSWIVNFYSDQSEMTPDSSATWIRSVDETMQVEGLTHLAVHVSPDNPHYGINGDYRSCDPRGDFTAEDITRCEDAEKVSYGLRGQSRLPEKIWVVATFNPKFDAFTDQIDRFLSVPDQ